jgi:hypothetical protein
LINFIFLEYWWEIILLFGFSFLILALLCFKKTTLFAKKYWWAILIILFVLDFPILLNKTLFKPGPPTPIGLGNAEWLAFWASFVGSLIGGVATFIAVTKTLKNNISENKKNRNLQIRHFAKQEYKRTRDVLPVLDFGEINNLDEYSQNKSFKSVVSIIDKDSMEIINTHIEKNMRYKFLDQKGIKFEFCISNFQDVPVNTDTYVALFIIVSNFGVAPAFKIGIQPSYPYFIKNQECISVIGKDQKKPLLIFFQKDIFEQKEITLQFHFLDIYKNYYTQDLKINLSKKTIFYTIPVPFKQLKKTNG